LSFTNGENPGAPYGARWDDNYHSGPAPRAERYTVQNPWTADQQCRNCKLTGGCREHNLLVPKVRVPGAPSSEDTPPCSGRYDLFDTEEPTPEALSLCASCPFQIWCLETATRNREHWTWAGTNRADRVSTTEGKAA
jgi:hypothetical protein